MEKSKIGKQDVNFVGFLSASDKVCKYNYSQLPTQ